MTDPESQGGHQDGHADTEARRAAMREELEAQRDRHRKEGRPSGARRRGLIIVNTGNGKGKTTAALGLMLRASGRGLKVRLFQFIKHERAKFGEHRALEQLNVEFTGLGDGFTWRSRDLDKTEELAREGWAQARAAIESGEWDMIVLDEFTYALKYGWVAWPEVEAVLRERDPNLHVIITGRYALPELIELADTVTEMQPVKHAYEAGVGAQAGIEH